MKILIENLGPIREAEIELGDITVLLGPPNTGKSYTLKTIYASLLMLDQIALKKEVENTVLEEFDVTRIYYIHHAIDIPQLLAIMIILYRSGIDIDSYKVKKLINYIKDEMNIHFIDAKIHENKITINLGREDNINIKKIVEKLKDKLDYFWYIVPLVEKTKIKVVPKKSFFEIFSIVSETMKESLLHTLKKELLWYRGKKYREFNIPITYKLSTELYKETLKVKREIEAECNLKNPVIEKIINLYKKRYDLDIVEYVRKTCDKEKELLPRKLLKLLFSPEFKYLLRRFYVRTERPLAFGYGVVIDKLIENITNSFRMIYNEVFKLNAVRFIPFGRSPFVYELEYISQEPFFRQKELVEIYMHDPIFYSYISWLSDGRTKFLRGEYDEKIAKIFSPVLQGEIKFDKQTKELKYKRWGYRQEVPMKLASALASEVSGIFLPILTVPPESCLIIEEPEAQLHYSAQILMAITLAGLSNEFNHKIIFSSHSDIFAITLAYLKELKPKEKIKELIEKLLRMQNIRIKKDNIEYLAKIISKKDLDVRFYYYKPTLRGVIVSEKTSKEILKEVPGMTDVVDTLASWALSL